MRDKVDGTVHTVRAELRSETRAARSTLTMVNLLRVVANGIRWDVR